MRRPAIGSRDSDAVAGEPQPVIAQLSSTVRTREDCHVLAGVSKARGDETTNGSGTGDKEFHPTCTSSHQLREAAGRGPSR